MNTRVFRVSISITVDVEVMATPDTEHDRGVASKFADDYSLGLRYKSDIARGYGDPVRVSAVAVGVPLTRAMNRMGKDEVQSHAQGPGRGGHVGGFRGLQVQRIDE